MMVMRMRDCWGEGDGGMGRMYDARRVMCDV